VAKAILSDTIHLLRNGYFFYHVFVEKSQDLVGRRLPGRGLRGSCFFPRKAFFVVADFEQHERVVFLFSALFGPRIEFDAQIQQPGTLRSREHSAFPRHDQQADEAFALFVWQTLHSNR
jgi:hypothetical protein